MDNSSAEQKPEAAALAAPDALQMKAESAKVSAPPAENTTDEAQNSSKRSREDKEKQGEAVVATEQLEDGPPAAKRTKMDGDDEATVPEAMPKEDDTGTASNNDNSNNNNDKEDPKSDNIEDSVFSPAVTRSRRGSQSKDEETASSSSKMDMDSDHDAAELETGNLPKRWRGEYSNKAGQTLRFNMVQDGSCSQIFHHPIANSP